MKVSKRGALMAQNKLGLLPVVLTGERSFSMVTSLFRLVKMLKITRQ